MTLAQFFHGMGQELQALLFADDERAGIEEEIDQLRVRIEQVRGDLERQRDRLDEMQKALHLEDGRVRELAKKVPIYFHLGDQNKAFSHALELDQQRATLATRRTELRHQRQAYDHLKSHLEQLERRLVARAPSV